MSKLIDLTGKTYGRLTVVSFIHREENKTLWNCVCSCGKNKITTSSYLQSGDTTSCGCYKSETSRKNNSTHKRSNSREYRIWLNMKSRCCNKKHHAYHDYGGRGIIVCSRWMNSFVNFLSDMGECPGVDYSIERIDNFGIYEPVNCKWGTRIEQTNNSRKNRIITYKNKVNTLAQWCRELGLPYKTIFRRLDLGWTTEIAFETPKLQSGITKRGLRTLPPPLKNSEK